jgi:Anti-sigma regulatory factor (Ser/Thr protein kinase)
MVMSSKLLTPSDKSLKIPARLDQLWRARAFVSSMAAAAGFEELRLSQIELAVDEACSNIVQHAYARRLDGEIDIRVQVERGRRIVITLVDTGGIL